MSIIGQRVRKQSTPVHSPTTPKSPDNQVVIGAFESVLLRKALGHSIAGQTGLALVTDGKMVEGNRSGIQPLR